MSIDTDTAQRVVVGSVAVAGVVAAGSTLARGDLPGIRLLVGVFGSGLMLAALAMFAPALAAGFAVLLLAASVFVYGGPLWSALTSLTQ